jgi:hypothetical protein
MTTTPAIPPSYDHGVGDRPLLGENFNQIATAHAHREALDLCRATGVLFAIAFGQATHGPGCGGPGAPGRPPRSPHSSGEHQTPAPATAQQQNRRSTSLKDRPAPSQRVHVR